MFKNKKELLFSNKDLLILFIPLLLSKFFEFFLGFADTFIVSALGESAISGVSLIDTIMQLIIFMFAALATGGAVVAGQYLGKKEVKKARDVSNQLIWFSFLISIVLAMALFIFRESLIHLLFDSISKEVWSSAYTYLTIVSFSIPFIALYNSSSAVFRTIGQSKNSLILMLVANILNIIGNSLSVYIFNLGVEGVAISTLIVRSIAGVGMIIYLTDKDLPLYFIKTLKPKFKTYILQKIIKVGVPFSIENGLFQFGKVIIMSLISTLGTVAIAANTVGYSISSLSLIPGLAINLSVVSVISRCVGAKDYKQAKYFNKKLLKTVYLLHFIINLIIIISIPLIISAYKLSDYTGLLASNLIILNAFFSITIWPLAFTLPGTFRGAGDSKFPMYVGIISLFIFRIALAFVLVLHFGMGIFGTWIAMFADWIVRAIIYVYRYFSGKWMKFRVIET